MRVAKLVPVLLALLCFLVSCSAKPGSPDENLMTYRSGNADIRSRGVRVAAALSVDPLAGIATVSLRVKNASDSPVVVNYEEAELVADGLYSSPAISVRPQDREVAPGTTTEYALEFKPVNNPSLFQRYMLTGDIRRQYSLNPGFVRLAAGTSLFGKPVDFSIPEERYSQYLNAQALESRLVSYACAENPDEFARAASAYLIQAGIAMSHDPHEEHGEGAAGLQGDELFVRMAGDEIYLDQCLIRISPYRIDGDIYVHLKIVNRMPKELKLNAANITLRAGDRILGTSPDFAGLKGQLTPLNREFDNETLVLGQNDRASFTLRYEAAGPVDAFSLIPDGIVTYQDRKVFSGEIAYRVNQN